MAKSNESRRPRIPPRRSLLMLAAGLILANLVTLIVLYLLPMPDPSVLPGRLPQHDITIGRP